MFPAAGCGYAPSMSDSETKPGPASPGEEGPDSPTPPGGPQRQDDAGPGLQSGDKGVGDQAEDSVEDRHGGTLSIEDEQPHESPAGETVGEERDEARQEHNAETTEDQPSQ
ncbi:MAG: hypothetical protein JWR20_2408 [Marmoricola sp.]|nr:hypothetical protein [Marmoricola sp.]